jgi:parallel beta-helix repeat protein
MKKILLITFHFWFMLPIMFGQFSGTYTINPGSPPSATNYMTINAAVKDITQGLRTDGGPVNGFGVTDPVIFNIADGDYNENLELTKIFNSSPANTITFQSASGDSTKVRIYYTPDGESNNCVVLLNNVNYTIFKDLTVEVSTETHNTANAVRIQNGSDNNVITHCILKGVPTTSNNTNYSTIILSNSTNQFNQITNNLVLEGSSGLFSTFSSQNIISGNHFKYQSYCGVQIPYGHNDKILNNTFTNPDNSSGYAIFLSNNHDSTHVIGNKIDGKYRAGIFLRNNYGTATKPTIVANNMIHLGGLSSEKYGIWSEYSDYTYFYYNSINLTNKNTNARCLYLNNGTANSNRIQNNNFISKYGPAVYINTPGTVEYSDYNNFYSENYQLGYWNGWKNDLAAWKSETLQDTNSISTGAKFITTSDLHTFDNQLDSLAKSIAAISTDIDGETRDATFPDIGADEFSGLDLDAELVSIDSIGNQICGGTQDIYVTLMNYGKATLTSLTIFAQVDGGASINFAWNGSLEKGATEAVRVGTLDFPPYSAQTLKVYCQLPNGAKDLNAGNDTISAEFKTALSGTYTIGGTSPDFFSIAQAFNAVTNYGVCGDVVFNIRDGEYEGYVTLNAIPGADSLNTVTFRSESSDSTAVTISSAKNDFTIKLNGTDYVTFEKLTIEQQNNGNVVEFYNNSGHNRILNCVLRGPKVAGTSSSYAVIYSDNSYFNSSNTFSNNVILNGTYGVYFRGQYLGNHPYNTVIADNTFMNQSYEGIFMQYIEAPLVSGNYISGNNNYSNTGIFISYCSNGFEISGNKIFSFDVGIKADGSSGTAISHDVILNNFVQSENTAGANGVGIQVTSSSYVDVYHNSVNEISNGHASAAIKISLGSNINIANNIFSAKTGYAYFIDTPSAISLSDNNNYYSSGSYLGKWNDQFSDIETLRALSGGDTHSWSVYPNFVSDTNLLTNNLALNNNGMPLVQVTKDITGATRNASTPDIGAIEFDAAGTEDVAMIKLLPEIDMPGCAGYYTIYGEFINNSPDTLLTCNLDCEINGVARPSVAFDGKLAPGKKFTLLIDSILFASGESYRVKVWSELPNGSNDDIPDNDTVETTLYAALNGTYTLGGTSPDFESFTDLANHLNYGGLCGPTTVNVRNGTYNEQIEIGDIAGSSADNHLTIQSESGNSDDVVLEWASTEYNKNYTLSLINTDHISFNNMTFKALGDAYGRVVYFNNNDSLLFTGNTFSNENKLLWSNSGNIYSKESELLVDNNNLNLVQSNNNNGNNKQFINNKFIGGNYSLYLDGAGPVTGTVIRQNKFSNSFYGLYVRDEHSIVISENVINATYSGMTLYSIYDKITVSKNHIVISGTENHEEVIGLSLLHCYGKPGIVSNNFISVLNNTDVYSCGIGLNSSYDVKLIHNNVRISNPNTYNSPLNIAYGSDNVIKNNVFANFGNGYAMKSNSSFENSVDSSDYNAYYTKGDFLFYINNYNIPTLDMLRFLTGKNEFDSNSVVVDPIFNSETDLHVNEISLNNQATPIGLITDDYDGDTRSLTTPDIGADEFDVMKIDATVSIVNTREDFLCDNAYTVYAMIRNLGKNTLTSGSVNWTANGVAQTALNWTGSLGAGETSDTIILGTYSYTKSGNDPFELMAWVSSPNGASDEKAANDTAFEKLYPGASGSFTIGHNGTEDFTSINEAINYLMNVGGLCGPVTFNISNGTYEEYVQLGEIKGASSTSTITFQSASGNAGLVTIAYDGGDDYDAVIALDGSDHVIFNNLTVEQYSSYDYCMQLDNGADSNMVTNCIFQNSNRGYSIYSENWYIRPNNYNLFVDNTFKDGSYGIEWNGYYNEHLMAENKLSESLEPEKGIVITGNKFINQDRGAINIAYCDSAIVNDNYITNADEATNYSEGIFIGMEYTKGYFVIEGNEVILNGGQFGIYVENSNGSQDELSLVANNFVSLKPINQGEGIFGMYFNNTGNLNIFNNTVSINNTPSSMYSSAFQIAPGSNVSILNNIWVNMDGGYAFSYIWKGFFLAKCDYTNYYTTGSIAFHHSNIENLTDLAVWKDYTGFDTHSLELDPGFVSGTDMHLCNNALDNKGVHTPYVTSDIDGQARNSKTPDIGADEFTSISNIHLGETLGLCDAPLILDAGPVNGTYSWSTGDTTQAISVTSTGTYSVSISSTCGSANDAVEVVQSTDIPTASFTTENSFLTTAFTNTSGNAESYMWKFGDGNMSAEVSPLHVYKGEGTYTVMLKAVNSCSSDSVESDVVIHITSLEESDFAEQVKVYPNPSDGRFSLELNFENSKDAGLQIYDIAGNLVYTESYRNIIFTNNLIDISGYPSGSYTLVLVVDNQFVTHKLIIE